MLVWSIEVSDSRELANQLASYLRRGFELMQIVYTFENKKPYKAFLLNKNQIKDNENLKEVHISESIVKKNLYTIKCKNVKKYKAFLGKLLYGNLSYLLEVNGKEIFFELVIVLNDELILKKAFDNKTKKSIKLNEKDIQKAICDLIKKRK